MMRMTMNTAIAAAILMIAGIGAAAQPDGPTPMPMPVDHWHDVTNYGAAADGVTDDTDAFQRALDAASPEGGVVWAPSLGPGRGYVITRTVRVPEGVALIGSPAGVATNSTAAFPYPEQNVVGSKIYARPAPEEYTGPEKRPLFLLERGCTVRGLVILYDEQPWPTDEEFQNPESPYHYAGFDEARERFLADHIRPYGPTFYVPTATNNVIEDIVCDRYYDFLHMRFCGKTYVDRIFCYGVKRAFVYGEGLDINRLSHVHVVPNAGASCPGPAPGLGAWTWIYAILASQDDNVGVVMGRNDGYVLDDVFFFGMHTALRLGASRDYPLVDPVAGDAMWYDTETQESHGFRADSYLGQGPWGEIIGFKVDQCAVGVHFVWPAHLANRIANALIFTAIDDGRSFDAVGGDGDLDRVGKQAAFVVEPSYSLANNVGIVGTFLCNNALIASFNDAPRFGPAAANAADANGRVFLINGDITMDFSGMLMNHPYQADRVHAIGPDVERAHIAVRGLIRTGVPQPDLLIQHPAPAP